MKSFATKISSFCDKEAYRAKFWRKKFSEMKTIFGFSSQLLLAVLPRDRLQISLLILSEYKWIY